MELLGTTDAAATAGAEAGGREGEGGEKRRNVPRSDAQLARSLARPRVSTVGGGEASFFSGETDEEKRKYLVPLSISLSLSLSLSLCS